MKAFLDQLLVEVQQRIEVATDLTLLEKVRVEILGKKGPIQAQLQHMKQLTPEQKKAFGQQINVIKNEIARLIEAKMDALEMQRLQQTIQDELVDVTMPAKQVVLAGQRHPLFQIIHEVETFFKTMGYEVLSGLEVEKDYYNFEAVNIPKDHPARDMQDTFFIDTEYLLRTHTSGIQARTLEQASAADFPIKIIAPGKVYRRDDDDATHSHQFMQIEGMYVGKNISMADLKGTLQVLVEHLFGKGRNIRLRPSYFPFVEPGVEVDVSCANCQGAGCSVCKKTGYIEILGAGLVHPSLLELANIDSTVYSGFAFGLGVDRVAMLKYGVEDIRHFYTNDLRFLKQFQ